MTAKILAAALACSGFIDGRGYSLKDRINLKPMPQDKYMLQAQKDQFSFVVDFIELEKLGSVRLFIHDKKADYTATNDGSFKTIGASKEIRLQQIIGYDSNEPMTLSLSCYLSSNSKAEDHHE